MLAVGSVDGRIYAFGDVGRFYRRDPPMDKFKNDRDVPIESWLEKFEGWFAVEGIVDPKVKLGYLKQRLADSLWHDIKRFMDVPYDQFKLHLMNLYAHPESEPTHYAEFQLPSQKTGEEATELIDRVRKVVNRGPKVYQGAAYERSLAEKFVMGSTDLEFRKWEIPKIDSGKLTPSKKVEKAAGFELARKTLLKLDVPSLAGVIPVVQTVPG